MLTHDGHRLHVTTYGPADAPLTVFLAHCWTLNQHDWHYQVRDLMAEFGHRIRIGDAVLRVTKPDARCAMTTHDPDTGQPDLDTLRTIISYRGLREGKNADFGVLAEVDHPGRVRLGDEVTPLD